jgi:hypothetical protein
MEKNIVFQNANLTQSALDAGDAQRSCAGLGDARLKLARPPDLSAFSSIFLVSSLFCSQAFSQPAQRQ